MRDRQCALVDTGYLNFLKHNAGLVERIPRAQNQIIPSISVSIEHRLVTDGVFPDQTRSSAIAEGPRDASCQLKSCQLPRNSAETTYTTSPDQIDGMKLEI